jgi:uracil-DNA glycosylase family 4
MNEDARRDYARAFGLDLWRRRGLPVEAAPAATATPATASAPGAALTAETAVAVERMAPATVPPSAALEREAAFDWPELMARVAACTRCGLSATRRNTVFGVGNRSADWLIVGEAPGAEEDAQGEPFVGRAGQLLNAMLRAVGLAREQVFIANVLKCRPPGNRDPQPLEAQECMPYLERQIELLQPKVMLAVGRIAAHNLLRSDARVGDMRLKVHAFGVRRVPLVVTYHPAYLLRSPGEKRKAWEDLKFARGVCAGVER